MIDVILLTVLFFLAIYDIRYLKLPNIVMFPLTIFLCFSRGTFPQVVVALMLAVIVYQHPIFNQKISEGDVKLAVLLAAMFGFIGIFGMIGGLLLVAALRYLTKERSAMAFTPFATLSTLVCILSDKAIGTIVR
jgi:Flp pilus assembly protein protease CpaA